MNKEYFSSINDVSKKLNIPAHTLRYWEKQFPVSIKPITGAGGRRYYRPETVLLLNNIKDLLYNKGMTISGVKRILKEGAFDSEIKQLKDNEDLQQALELLNLAKKELEI